MNEKPDWNHEDIHQRTYTEMLKQMGISSELMEEVMQEALELSAKAGDWDKELDREERMEEEIRMEEDGGMGEDEEESVDEDKIQLD